ncbi:MAG: hypothetical protein NTW86_18875 [Candidatus Sumerlaeota bacterium]|nr:hypothetical protein [Candidatus Sumerlaeota bacterium]
MNVWRFALAALLPVALLAEGCSGGKGAVAGTYLMEGVQSYLVLESKGSMLTVTDARDSTYEYRVTGDGTRLLVEFRTKPENLRTAGPQGSAPNTSWDGFYELTPSTAIPGDWDLVRCHGFDWWKAAPPRETIAPLPQPIASFLHRIDDARIPTLMKLASGDREHRDPPKAAALAKALLNGHPDDPYVRILYLETILLNSEVGECERRAAEWKPAFLASAIPFIQEAPGWIDADLAANRAIVEGRNARPRLVEMWKSDLTHWLEVPAQLLDCDTFADPSALLLRYVSVPNLLVAQISGKVAHVAAVMMMIQGRRDEALRLGVSYYHIARLMNENGTLIQRLIGMAMRSVTLKTLQIYALNCCETPEEFQRFWDQFAKVEPRPLEYSSAEFIRYEAIGLAVRGSDQYATADDTASVRQRTANASAALLRMTAAAKRHFIEFGAFPANEREFTPLLPEGPPPDPFGGQPLRFSAGVEPFVCYSVGPDETDNSGAISYDPTNGTRSAGDILVKVPSQREFAFPREGTKAASPDDFRRQYPNGLPSDPLASTRGRGLWITETTPVCVYSFGPDVDEMRTNVARPDVLYDPTNGINSRGDLWIQIPER